MHISSTENPLVKGLVRLRTSAAERRERQQVLLTGRKIIEEVAQRLPLLELWQLEGSPPLTRCNSILHYSASDGVLRKITGLENPDGYAAVVAMPAERRPAAFHRVVALDSVSDPSNLGALLRSAWALGWDGALLLPGCCDPYNDKALRSSRGAPLFFPWLSVGNADLWQLAAQHDMLPLAAQLNGTDLKYLQPITGNLLLVMGSEGHGVSPAIAEKCQSVTIAIDPAVESLNVGAAAAILLWQLK